MTSARLAAGSLTVTGLRKSFRGRTILDFDFELDPGEFCLLLGENGVGKSTFFRCLLGLENFEGRVEVGGCRRWGQVFGVLDEPMMYPRWTVAQNIRYLLNDSHADRSDAVSELIDPPFLRRRAASLSTGEKKMVCSPPPWRATRDSCSSTSSQTGSTNGLEQRCET